MVGESHTLQENASRLAHFALEMQRVCSEAVAPDGSPVVMRVGLHCGPVVGGVVGGNMLRYQFRPSPLLPFQYFSHLPAVHLPAVLIL